VSITENAIALDFVRVLAARALADERSAGRAPTQHVPKDRTAGPLGFVGGAKKRVRY